MVKVLEEDDGSGWVKVANSSGKKGLVPASYVEAAGPGEESKATTKASVQYGASIYLLRFRLRWDPSLLLLDRLAAATNDCNLWCPLTVRGLYDYRATGSDEIGVKEGRKIRLTTGPRGGQNYGDGWWEGRFFPCHSVSFGGSPLSTRRF